MWRRYPASGRVASALRERIGGADIALADIALLETWLDRVVTAPSLDALFEPPPAD